MEDGDAWRASRVLWTGGQLDGHLPAAACAAGEAVWLGTDGGLVAQWAPEPGAGGQLRLARILAAHQRPVRSLRATDAGLLTVDAGGLACLWDSASGECRAARSLGIHPGACALSLAGGLAAVESQLLGPDSSVTPVDGLAVLDASLAIIERLAPAAMLPLVQVADPGAKAAGIGRIMALSQPESPPGRGCVVGITAQGLLLLWRLNPGAGSSLPRQRPAAEHSLTGGLRAASFSRDGQLLLVVASGGWALFRSRDWWGGAALAASGSASCAGGLLLEGRQQPDGTSAAAALVWDSEGAGQLLSCSGQPGGSAELLARTHLPGGSTAGCVAALGDGSSAFVAFAAHAAGCQPSVVRLLPAAPDGQQNGAANGSGTAPGGCAASAADAVTVCMLARPGSGVPDLCFKGFASGALTAEPLAAAALGLTAPVSAASGVPWRLAAHASAVTCLLEQRCRLPHTGQGPADAVLLLSGGADGSVQATHARGGRCLWRLSPHTAEVVALSAPPQAAARPWASHALSCAADGSCCLLALERGQCLHLIGSLPGPTAGSRPGFLWSAARGYLAAFTGFQPSGFVAGFAADALESPLWAGSSSAAVGGSCSAVLWDVQSGRQERRAGGSAARGLVSDLAAQQPALPPAAAAPGITCRPAPAGPASAQLLHVDVAAVLSQPAAGEPAGAFPGGQLLTALALLHTAGLDPAVDGLLLRALGLAGLLPGCEQSYGSSAAPSLRSCLGDVHCGAGGGLTLTPPAAASTGLACPAWQATPERTASRLLALVSLAKRLQAVSSEAADDSLAAALCNAAAALTALYTVRLPELLPAAPRPSVLSLAAHFQAEDGSVREAARTLLAAATDPALLGLPDPAPYAALVSLIHSGQPQQPAAGLSPAQAQAGQAWRPRHILAAAAVCMLHPTSMPAELAAHALPGLLAIACARGSSCAAAAGLLAEALLDPGLARCRRFLGDPASLTKRLLEACEAASAEAAAARPASAKARASPSASTAGPQQAQAAGSAAAAPGQSALARRDALLGALAAAAQADARTFLHMLGHRLAGGGQGSGTLLALMTLTRVLHSPGGRRLLSGHLQLLTAVVLKGLEPPHAGARASCRQSVLALVKELAIACPTVALHEPSLQLAVGRTTAAAQPAAEPLGGCGGGEPVSVHDLASGRKKRAIHFRLEGSLGGGNGGESVAALAFSGGGEALAGWSPGEGCLRVWQLVAKWSDRLQRGPALLTPSQVFNMEVPPAMRSGASSHAWDLVWEADAAVQVLYGGACVARAALQ